MLPCHVCRLDKAHYSLDLSWLLQLDATPLGTPTQDGLTSTAYAHLTATALLTSPTKGIRTQACSVLKSLWLLESIRALHSNPATARPAQHAQHAMLTLLMHWVPALSAYPEAAPAHLQLLTWTQHTTPGLAGQLETASSGSGSAKKKKTSSHKTPPVKASRPEAAGSQAALVGTSEFSQGAVITSELLGVVAALRTQSGVLADHLQGSAYRSLQVCVLMRCTVQIRVTRVSVVKACEVQTNRGHGYNTSHSHLVEMKLYTVSC